MDPTSLNPLWPAPQVVLTFALVAAAGGAVAWWTARRLALPVRAALAVLRVAGIALLAVIALNPGRWLFEETHVETEWAVLVDTSASMATDDLGGATPGRLDRARELAAEVVRLTDGRMPVHVYPFGAALGREVKPEAFGGLQPTGETTDIPLAGQALFARTAGSGRGLSGIILLSDGRQVASTPAEPFALRARAREAPVYALPLSGHQAVSDLAVRADRRHYVGFPGQPLRVAAVVEASGLGRIAPVVELLDAEGQVVARESAALDGDGTARVNSTLEPEAAGFAAYRFRAAPLPGEAREDNNEAGFGVTVLAEPLRILVAEGTPYWDSKFLVQFLRRQPNMEVVSNYRLSSERFFQVQTALDSGDQTSRPVFPDSLEELSRYDMVVFGKGAEYFLTPERIAILRDYVREQGGTVLFARGKPYATPVPGLDALEPGAWGDALETPFTFAPTAAGREAGLFDDELVRGDATIWQKLPPLEHAHTLPRLKPFAEVLVNGLTHQAGVEHTFPAVIAQRYGQGVAITVNADGLWTWDFSSREDRGEQLYERFWNQLVQWAVTFAEYLPGQEYSLRLSATSAAPGEKVRATIGRRSAAGEGEAPVVSILRGREVVGTLHPSAVPGAGTRWELLFSLPESGSYRVSVGPEGATPGEGPSEAFEVILPPTETSNTAGDTPYLRALAEASGGGLITVEDLPGLLDPQEATVTVTQKEEAEWQTRWDTPWLLALLLGCFSLEWIVRRRNGLL